MWSLIDLYGRCPEKKSRKESGGREDDVRRKGRVGVNPNNRLSP